MASSYIIGKLFLSRAFYMEIDGCNESIWGSSEKQIWVKRRPVSWNVHPLRISYLQLRAMSTLATPIFFFLRSVPQITIHFGFNYTSNPDEIYRIIFYISTKKKNRREIDSKIWKMRNVEGKFNSTIFFYTN